MYQSFLFLAKNAIRATQIFAESGLVMRDEWSRIGIDDSPISNNPITAFYHVVTIQQIRSLNRGPCGLGGYSDSAQWETFVN